jgi:GxxExxY protein
VEYLHNDLTDRIIRCFYEVYHTLGFGFLEIIYERALTLELMKSGLSVRNQVPVKVHLSESNKYRDRIAIEFWEEA